MLKHFKRSAVAPLKMAVMLALAVAARAAVPYLPLVGPPSLRVEAPRSIGAGDLSLVMATSKAANTNAQPAGGSTNLAVSPVFGTASASNAAVSASMTNMPEVTTSESGTVESNQSLGDTFTASVFALPTPNLLGITPQALATYFRPVYLGTNEPIVGPFPLSFIPPIPPDKSSHAEYILK